MERSWPMSMATSVLMAAPVLDFLYLTVAITILRWSIVITAKSSHQSEQFGKGTGNVKSADALANLSTGLISPGWRQLDFPRQLQVLQEPRKPSGNLQGHQKSVWEREHETRAFLSLSRPCGRDDKNQPACRSQHPASSVRSELMVAYIFKSFSDLGGRSGANYKAQAQVTDDRNEIHPRRLGSFTISSSYCWNQFWRPILLFQRDDDVVDLDVHHAIMCKSRHQAAWIDIEKAFAHVFGSTGLHDVIARLA
jgi:hypothetical protein